MKKLIIVGIIACGTLLAAVSLDETAKAHIKAMHDDGSITNVVNTLIADGTVCQVRGHQWEFGCGMVGCLVNHSGPMRHCSFCSTTQPMEVEPSNWQPRLYPMLTNMTTREWIVYTNSNGVDILIPKK